MKDIKNVVMEMITELTNDLQATANKPCYNNDGILNTDNIKVTFYSDEKEPKPLTKTITIQDENDALNQGRIVSAFESQTNERLQKLEKCVSDLQSKYRQLIRLNNRNANALYGLYNTIKSYDCGLSERLIETEQNKKE